MTDKDKQQAQTCGADCEVYSRVCGYFRPVSNWNKGKKEEFKDRKAFVIEGRVYISKTIDSGYDAQRGIEYNTTESELIGYCNKP